MIEKKGAYWFPKSDYHCFFAVHREIHNIHKMITYCQGRDCAVQAGGNVGLFPLEMVKYFKKVFTFEPDPVNYACLEANTLNNERIFPIHAGLGSEDELVELSREDDNCGAHYVHGKGNLRILPLDRYDLSACDLIQLDIEGYEYKALLGAWKTINQFHPVIICEEKGLGGRFGVEREAIGQLLFDIGYRLADRIDNDVIYTYSLK